MPRGASPHLFAIIDYEDEYVQPLLLSALKNVWSETDMTLVPLSKIFRKSPDSKFQDSPEPCLEQAIPSAISSPQSFILQVSPYEALDFTFANTHPNNYLINSYMIRKALIRKHYLASTVANWVAKRPESILKTHVKITEAFELDYAEFLDDALIECWDLRESMDRNAAIEQSQETNETASNESGVVNSEVLPFSKRVWWILKPSMSDRGQGIKLFSTMEELQTIFDEWEAGITLSDEEDDNANEGKRLAENDRDEGYIDNDHNDMLAAAHLRHFVAQPYIHPPLIVPGDNRKFHIRTYVVCLGAMAVYVYRPMLMLFAAQPYLPPWKCTTGNVETFLTNTCLQVSKDIDPADLVQEFWSSGLSLQQKEKVFAQICAVTGEIFEAAARGMMMHFQPLANAFEVFGLDFLVDYDETAWLLEVNSFPDFKQTGDKLTWLVEGLWEEVLSLAITNLISSNPSIWKQDSCTSIASRGSCNASGNDDRGDIPGAAAVAKNLVCVKKVELGRRFGA